MDVRWQRYSSGTMVKPATDKLVKAGAEYKGTYDVKFYDVNGNLTGEGSETSVPDRLTVE
jgi:hypothetical protein